MKKKDYSTISLLIPVYNELSTLSIILSKLITTEFTNKLHKEIIIIDDHSTDGSKDLIKKIENSHFNILKPYVEKNYKNKNREFNDNIFNSLLNTITLKTHYQTKNVGKGAAVQQAINLSTGDYVIIQDADLEYNPEDINKLLTPILENRADVVYGSRFKADISRVLYFRHTIGNKFLTFISNLLTDLNLTDLETCYKMFKGDIIRSIYLNSNRFGFEPEITAKISKAKLRIYEVPITYYGRTYTEGKKITWRDGLAAIWFILKYNLLPVKIYKDTGHETLLNLNDNNYLNDQFFSKIRPFIKPNSTICEAGCGIGNTSKFFTVFPETTFTLCDQNRKYLEYLNNFFFEYPNISVKEWDLETEFQEKNYFDLVISSNVLEHIKDDSKAVSNVYKSLKIEGRLILVIPEHQNIFCNLDKNLGHYRRYSKSSIKDLLLKNSFEVETITSFNFLGLIGWFIIGKLFRFNTIKRESIFCYNKLFKFFTLFEKIIPINAGASIYVVAKKNSLL